MSGICLKSIRKVTVEYTPMCFFFNICTVAGDCWHTDLLVFFMYVESSEKVAMECIPC